MRAIITGATGAVGMALIRELLNNGDHVLVLVRPASKRNARLPRHSRLKIIECPLEELSELCIDGTYDAFFHLGWEGTVGAARNDMELQIRNIRHSIAACRLAFRLGCKVFMGAGSQAEYGRASVKLSSDTPTFPENGYGMAKLCAAQMSRVECAALGVKHIWVRILSVYGEYDGEGSLISSTIRKLMDGEPTEFTDCEQKWDYIYAADAANIMRRLSVRGRDGGVYCLGSGEVRPLREYIEKIRDRVSPSSSLGFGVLPYTQGQVTYLCADTSELIRDIGELKLTPFEVGIERTVEWYKERRMSLEKN